MLVVIVSVVVISVLLLLNYFIFDKVVVVVIRWFNKYENKINIMIIEFVASVVQDPLLSPLATLLPSVVVFVGSKSINFSFLFHLFTLSPLSLLLSLSSTYYKYFISLNNERIIFIPNICRKSQFSSLLLSLSFPLFSFLAHFIAIQQPPK